MNIIFKDFDYDRVEQKVTYKAIYSDLSLREFFDVNGITFEDCLQAFEYRIDKVEDADTPGPN